MLIPQVLAWLAERGWLMFLRISSGAAFPPPLDREEEQALIDRMLAGDRGAGDALIEHNLRLAAHIAKKYDQPGVDRDDLISIGTLGLIKAVRTFRPEAGRLSGYASRCIENEILMFFRARRKEKNTVLLGEAAGRDTDGEELPLSELLGTEPDLVAREAETAIEAGRALRLMDSVLDERELEVVRRRYGLVDGEPRQQREVAAALGISRSYVSRIEKRALEKLRRALDGEDG